MKTYNCLFQELISLKNFEEAYEKARKRKSFSKEVQNFQEHWRLNLIGLRKEIMTKTYAPQPLKTFILRDPKTRVICVSSFRDRIVHHILVNVLQPIFESRFIFDSYASRQGKGTLLALERFDNFVRKVSCNGMRVHDAKSANQVLGYVLKADIKHYFETVDQKILLGILQKKIKDVDVLWLTRIILENYNSGNLGKGMPLGNWTSQFFANIYLNELDQFVKHQLRAKYYNRYVDDFLILHHSKIQLKDWKQKIAKFLESLKLELHPQKTTILPLGRGVSFLGFRCFYHHKLVRQRNLRKVKSKLTSLLEYYSEHVCEKEEVINALQGWNAYAMHGNTYRLRQRLVNFVEAELELSRNNKRQH